MIYLATNRYRKTRHFEYQDETYWPISPFGDGNCGLYAFACGLIDSIPNKKLTIEDDKFNKFIRYIQIFSNILHRPSKLNDETESDISKFLELIRQPNLTFDKFQNFFILYPLTRNSIIAFNVICNQALRRIGVESYAEAIGIPVKEFLKEDKRLLENRVWVGQQILTPLANYFGITVKLIAKNCPNENDPSWDYYYHQPLDNKTPTFALLLERNHWHYLIPREQQLGLAAILPFANKQRRIARQLSHSEVKIDSPRPLDIKDKKNPSEKIRRTSRELLHLNEELIQEIKNDKEKPFDFAKTTLNNLAIRLKQVFNFLVALKDIFNNEPNQIEEPKKAEEQAKTAAQDSIQILNAWREQWGVSNSQDELDKHLHKLGLHHEFEKDLFKNTLHNSDNAAIILQNAYIADFLSRNYTILKTCIPSLSTNNCSADIRDHNQSVMAHDQRIAALCISV